MSYNKPFHLNPRMFFRRRPEFRWVCWWLLIMTVLFAWDMFFLNRPAFLQIVSACMHSLLVASGSVALALVSGWALAMGHYQSKNISAAHQAIKGAVALLRSVPQIVILIAGYTVLTYMIEREALSQALGLILITAALYAFVTMLEFHDLIVQRVEHFQRSDFVQASLVCGLSEFRIMNRDILWSNSKPHFLNKTVSLAGAVIFLQCSFDFIISVGLSAQISSSNFPVTLGSLLTKMDSKKDILAFGTSWFRPDYWPRLLTDHLQGLSLAMILVTTLVCLYKFTEEYSVRKKL